MIVHEHRVLRTFPLVGAGNLEVLVEVHSLVLVDDDLFVVRLQVEVLLLELHRVAAATAGRVRYVSLELLRLIEFGVRGVARSIAGNAGLRLAGDRSLLQLLAMLTRLLVIRHRVWLLKVLNVVVGTPASTGFKLFASLRNVLRSRDLLLWRIAAAALFLPLVAILIVVLSRAYERRQPDTTG